MEFFNRCGAFLQRRQKVFKAVWKMPAPFHLMRGKHLQPRVFLVIHISKENLLSMRKMHIQVSIPDVS